MIEAIALCRLTLESAEYASEHLQFPAWFFKCKRDPDDPASMQGIEAPDGQNEQPEGKGVRAGRGPEDEGGYKTGREDEGSDPGSVHRHRTEKRGRFSP